MKVTKYPFRELVLDERCQARTEKYPEAIDDYAAAYRDKAELPPIDVFLVNGVPWVVDGFHRVAALAVTRTEWVRCRVLGDGTEEQAVWQALAANKSNGIRRTKADKRKAVLAALESPIGNDQSSRVIAEHVGVSHEFVSRVRAEWEKSAVNVDSSELAAGQLSEPARDQLRENAPAYRVGKDGKKYAAKRPKAEVQTVSTSEQLSSGDSSNDSGSSNGRTEGFGPEDGGSSPSPETLPPYGSELERAATAIGRLRVELRRYELPNRFVQSIESGLKSVESTLRYAVPETCPRCQGTRCIHCRDRGWVERAEGDQLRATSKRLGR